jgi:hypothetical protein
MSRPARYFFAGVIAAACHATAAQQTTVVPPETLVQQLAPQLVAFAGSPLNFQNLVNGLAQGTPIQLTTVLPNGSTQVVSFTPAGTLTATQIAQVLEATRQQLIGLGIGNPTGEQIANALVGTAVPTPLGRAPLSPTLQSQSNIAATGSTAPTPTTPVNVQLTPSATPPARINTSDSLTPAGATSRTPVLGNVSDTPTPPVATTTPQAAQPAQMAPPAAAAPGMRPMR